MGAPLGKRGVVALGCLGRGALSLLIFLVMLEAGLRVTGITRDYAGHEDNPALYENDPVLGYRMGSNLKDVPFTGQDWGTTPISTNESGWRDDPLARSEGRRRVLLLGDSVVAGLEVSREATMAERLQALLGEGVEVINAGTRGYSTAQEVLVAEQALQTLSLSAVVLVTVWNDPGDNVVVTRAEQAIHRAVFTLGGEGLVLPAVPIRRYPLSFNVYLSGGKELVEEDRGEAWLARRARKRRFQELRRRLAIHQAVSLVKHRLADAKAQARGDTGARQVFDVWKVSVAPPDTEESRARLELYCRLIRRLETSVTVRGVPLLVSAYVGRHQLDPTIMGLTEDTLDPTWLERYTAGCLAGPGRFVSAYAAFRGGFDHEEPLWWPHDEHLTPDGHRLFAEVLAPPLKEVLGQGKTMRVTK